MAEPLAVDPARLIAAGGKLAELVFPTAPSPIAVTGSDSVSAAINETMPGIESLVSDGLPGVTAALKRTASSMSTAADIYAKADQSLGDALTQFQFGADGQALGAHAVQALGANALAGAAGGLTGQSAQLLGAPMGAASGIATQVSEAVGAQTSALTPRVAATVPQLVQLAPQAGQMAQQASPIAQTIQQSAQQAGSQGSQGAAPAQLASDTKPEDEESKKDDEDEGEGARDEAAAGAEMLGSVPMAGPSGAAAGNATPLAAPI
jgi:hypothetical protein